MEILITIGVVLVILYVIFRIFKAIIKWVIIIIIVIAVVGFFTNPDETDHRQSFKEAIQNLPFKVKEKAVEVKDYKIFSLTKVTLDGEEKIVGVGAFGKVWYFRDIDDRLKKSKK